MNSKTRLHIRRFITAFCIAMIMWVIMSTAEISGHNHATLYGENKPYSNWNLIVLFDNALERK